MMARPLRPQFSGAVYHVTGRGNRREPIFADDTDRRRLLAIVRDTALKFEVGIWAYCLMRNHYHFVVQTMRPNVSRVMRQINGLYTQSFNRRHETVGHLFQGRFHSIVVDRDAYMLEVCRYVELNPVRAGLVPSPADWAWSSYRAHTGSAPVPEWLRTTSLHQLLCGDAPANRPEGQARYAELVASARDVAPWQADLRDRVFLGDEAFVATVIAAVRTQGTRPLDPADTTAAHCRPAGIRRSDDLASADALRRAHEQDGTSMADLARQMGVAVSTVSRAIRRSRGAAD